MVLVFKHQIEDVVLFGKRADNVQEKHTMGGGFGLTKAYHTPKVSEGKMWIASAANEGTRTNQIPSRSISQSKLYY